MGMLEGWYLPWARGPSGLTLQHAAPSQALFHSSQVSVMIPPKPRFPGPWLRCPSHLLMELTLGTVSLSQTPSARSRSRISQANMVGFCRL